MARSSAPKQSMGSFNGRLRDECLNKLGGWTTTPADRIAERRKTTTRNGATTCWKLKSDAVQRSKQGHYLPETRPCPKTGTSSIHIHSVLCCRSSLVRL